MNDASMPEPAVPSVPTTLRAYVNERGVSVSFGATVRDAVAAFDMNEAEALDRGERRVTDSRGLPIDADAPLHGGAIFRLLPVRSTAVDEPRTENAS